MSITPYGMYVALTPQHKPEHPRDVDASYVPGSYTPLALPTLRLL